MNNEGSKNKESAPQSNEQAAALLPGQLEKAGGNGEVDKPKWLRGPLPWWAELAEVEPWPEPVNGAELLDGILGEKERFVVFPKWGGVASSLFVLHTYGSHLRPVTVYLGVESPEKECGKSTLLTVLSRLVDRPALSSNISASAFFHVIDELRPTLLVDEADTNLRSNSDLMGILNAGYAEPTGFVWRMHFGPGAGQEAGEGGAGPGGGNGSGVGHPARYSCWCPKAIAAIGNLPVVLASRCIVIRMQRKSPDEMCKRLKYLKTEELKRKCARFVMDHAEEIANAEPEPPVGLSNRAADIWEPLLVLADLAGGRWPALAREAAVGLTAQAQGHSPIGALLMDVLLLFAQSQSERMFSRELVEILEAWGERPWGELRRGRKVTEAWLAQELRPYGIRPRLIRLGEEVARGYVMEEMVETFRRYIPKAELERAKAEIGERAMPKGEEGAS